MYDPLLDTFAEVARCGSFSKAANALYISVTAVMKQIDKLEEDVGIRLFSRTKRGTELTEAGKVFLEDSQFLIRYSKEALARVRQVGGSQQNVVRVGTSLFRPPHFLLERWPRVQSLAPEISLQLISIPDDFAAYFGTVERLGIDLDIIASTYPPGLWGGRCAVSPLPDAALCLAVPHDHPLCGKEVIRPEELCGLNVMLLKRGQNIAVDAAWDLLEKAHASVISVADYDLSVFNRCVSSGNALLIPATWRDVHPLLSCIKIEWDLAIPYGLLHAKEPREAVSRFLDIVSREVWHSPH